MKLLPVRQANRECPKQLGLQKRMTSNRHDLYRLGLLCATKKATKK